MGSFHRTQILFEPWQHAALKALAEREGDSISGVVRRLVTRKLGPRSTRSGGLRAIAGIGRDRKAAGREHDRWLYGAAGPA
jgi:hypothetical protein